VGKGKLKELARLTGGTGEVPSGAKVKKQKKDAAEEEGEEEAAEAEAGDEEEEEELELEGEEPSTGTSTSTSTSTSTGTSTGAGPKAAVILVDHDITPSQTRNLERATDAEVLDRTAVILAIFQRHARTHEARMQVEIARLSYLAPRLRETGGGGDRQRGGIGGKGAGESTIELDRRKIRDRIAQLREELEEVQREAVTRRRRRAEQNKVALVGYTNAGKSSLMRALTGGEVYIADKLFATLDTTVRVLQPETRPKILVTDTVGFIKKLPHELVASFRSTLDEAREASLLVDVADASDPAFRDHIRVTREVLGEIGANEAPTLLVLNKADRLDAAACAALTEEFPRAMLMSARRPEDVARLRDRIVDAFERDMVEEELFVAYAQQRLVHQIHESCRVIAEQHDEHGTRVRVRAPAGVLAKLRQAL
jgi:GTP-binding protein HflX